MLGRERRRQVGDGVVLFPLTLSVITETGEKHDCSRFTAVLVSDANGTSSARRSRIRCRRKVPRAA